MDILEQHWIMTTQEKKLGLHLMDMKAFAKSGRDILVVEADDYPLLCHKFIKITYYISLFNFNDSCIFYISIFVRLRLGPKT